MESSMTIEQKARPSRLRAFLSSHPVSSYFAMTFTISWLGALFLAAPHLLRGEALPKITGILIFPAMLLGPSITGLLCTGLVDGKSGVRRLIAAMFNGEFRRSGTPCYCCPRYS
jgi:hypothetical protein